METTVERRSDVRIVNGYPNFSSNIATDIGWIVEPSFGWATVEFGPEEKRHPPPAEFGIETVLRSVPEQAFVFPFSTSFDYEQLRRTSVGKLLRNAVRGPTQIIYRRIGQRYPLDK